MYFKRNYVPWCYHTHDTLVFAEVLSTQQRKICPHDCYHLGGHQEMCTKVLQNGGLFLPVAYICDHVQQAGICIATLYAEKETLLADCSK